MARRPVFELFDTLNEVRRITLASTIVSMHITDVAFWAHRLRAVADELDRLGRLADGVETGLPAQSYGGDDEDCEG